MRLLVRLLAVVAMAAPISLSAGTQSIWFCPIVPFIQRAPFNPAYPPGTGYMELFQPNAPWEGAAQHVDVFKVYAQWLRVATDAQLQQQFADLKRRHIALALEDGLQTRTPNCGQGLEGYGGDTILKRVRRIRDNGGDLRYVQMDEPIYYGSIYNGPTGCRRSVHDTIVDVANNCKALWSEFPDAEVGDIEPIVGESGPIPVRAVAGGNRAVSSACGQAVGVVHRRHQPDPARRHRSAKTVAHNTGFRKGPVRDDLQWTRHRRPHVARHNRSHNMANVEGAIGMPDIAIFQSWDPRPLKLLPDTDPDCFTSIINRYCGTRTRLTIEDAGAFVDGQLLTSSSHPIADVPVSATLVGRSPSAETAAYSIHGNPPIGATEVVMAIKINTTRRHARDRNAGNIEPDPATWLGSGPLRVWDPREAAAWAWLDHAETTASKWATVQGGQLHVVEQPGQPLEINSPAIDVDPAKTCTMTVEAAIPYTAFHSGYFACVFLKDHREVNRVVIPFAPPPIDLGVVMTDRNGRFGIRLPAKSDLAAGFHVEAQYEGDMAHWPSFATADR